MDNKKSQFDNNLIKGKVLIINLERLGDSILAGYSIFELLKNENVNITIVCKKPGYNYFSSISGNLCLYEYKNIIDFFKWQKDKIFDYVFDLTLRDDIESVLLTCIVNSKYKRGYGFFLKKLFYKNTITLDYENMHNVDVYSKILGFEKNIRFPVEYKNIKQINERVDIFLKKSANEKTIIFHPGGYYPTQRWCWEYYVVLAELINKSFPAKIIIFATAKEKFSIKIGALVKNSKMIIDGNINLIIELMKRSDILVCSNSGMMHLANSIGLFAISFLGPTDEKKFYPLTEKNIVLKANISCLGCGKGFCDKLSCMKDIKPHKVFSIIKNQLNNKNLNNN